MAARERLSTSLFYLLFFMPLLGTSVLGYLLMLMVVMLYVFTKPSSVTSFGLCFGLLLFLYFILKLDQVGDFKKTSEILRFFLGWSIVLPYMYYTRTRFSINTLILLLAIEIIVEGVLVNTVLPVSILRNYPDFSEVSSHQTEFYGFFQRVYSVGNNATITSTIICMLLSCRASLMRRGVDLHNRYIEPLSLVAILLCASGVGFYLYVLYIFYRFQLWKPKHIILLVIFSFVIFYLASGVSSGKFSEDSIFTKLSFEYIEFLWDFKLYEYEDYFRGYNFQTFLFGVNFHKEEPLIWGDFAWLEYFLSAGFLGILFLFALVFRYSNRLNFYPIIIALIGMLHYGGICAYSGQLIFAYCLLLNKDSFSYYSHLQSRQMIHCRN